jgi:branched-chain amino acid transport system permease protein
MTPYIVGGLVLGGIYAIASLGLVITYTSSRVFNFAYGAIAYFLALTFHELAVDHGWNRVVAGVVTVLIVSPAVGLFLWAVLFRQLTHAPPYVRLVSTVGLWVAIPPIARLLYGRGEIFDRIGIGPTPAHTYEILGVVVDSDQLLVLLAAIAIAIVTAVVLRYTPFGLMVRATVDSPTQASISGVNTAFVSAGTWMIGTAFAGLSGILLAPLRGYVEYQYTFLLLAAFAAVVIARMHSLVLAVAGAFLIGVLQNIIVSRQAEDFLTTFIPRDSQVLRGLQPSIPFILMAVFLLAYQNLRREQFVTDPRALGEPASRTVVVDAGLRRRRIIWFAIVIAAVLLAPEVLPGRWEAVVAKGLALGIAFLSYTIVTGEGGMISLCQVTFAGVGGALTAEFATNQGVPVLVAVLLGALVVVPLGLLIALPSLRLGGLYLALATLAFAELVQNMYFQQKSVNNFDSGVAVPRPVIGSLSFGSDRAFYYLLVGAFLLFALLVLNVKRSRTGLTLAAVRSSEPAAATLGIRVSLAKMAAFGISAFIAAFGGGLYVTYAERSLPARSFNSLIGVVWLAIVVTWGVRSVLGALLAGLAFAVFPQLFSEYLPTWALEVPTMLFGLGAIALAREPRGVVFQVTERRHARRAKRAARRTPAMAATA